MPTTQENKQAHRKGLWKLANHVPIEMSMRGWDDVDYDFVFRVNNLWDILIHAREGNGHVTSEEIESFRKLCKDSDTYAGHSGFSESVVIKHIHMYNTIFWTIRKKAEEQNCSLEQSTKLVYRDHMKYLSENSNDVFKHIIRGWTEDDFEFMYNNASGISTLAMKYITNTGSKYHLEFESFKKLWEHSKMHADTEDNVILCALWEIQKKTEIFSFSHSPVFT